MSPNLPIRLLVSTRNAHKVTEIRAILGTHFDVSDLSSLPAFGEVEETGSTFEENAALKAVAASLHFDGWVIADDSGLEVDALGGAPGVYSARYAGPASVDSENNALLLQNLADVHGKDRSARFRCVIVIARAGRKMAAFDGTVEGILRRELQGGGGFGYDPLFVPEGHDLTFAELPPEIKNTISHRSRALAKLKAWQGWF
jgi:XTP/dITP diphosphohydrolase